MKTEQLETFNGYAYPSAHVQTYPQISQVRPCVAFDGGNRFIKWVDPENEVRMIPSCIKEVSETQTITVKVLAMSADWQSLSNKSPARLPLAGDD